MVETTKAIKLTEEELMLRRAELIDLNRYSEASMYGDVVRIINKILLNLRCYIRRDENNIYLISYSHKTEKLTNTNEIIDLSMEYVVSNDCENDLCLEVEGEMLYEILEYCDILEDALYYEEYEEQEDYDAYEEFLDELYEDILRERESKIESEVEKRVDEIRYNYLTKLIEFKEDICRHRNIKKLN